MKWEISSAFADLIEECFRTKLKYNKAVFFDNGMSLRIWSDNTGTVWKAAINDNMADGIQMFNIEFCIGGVSINMCKAHSTQPIRYLSIAQMRGDDIDGGIDMVIV